MMKMTTTMMIMKLKKILINMLTARLILVHIIILNGEKEREGRRRVVLLMYMCAKCKFWCGSKFVML